MRDRKKYIYPQKSLFFSCLCLDPEKMEDIKYSEVSSDHRA